MGVIGSVITSIVPGMSAVTFTEAFTNQTSVTVTHNLGYYPVVQVIDDSAVQLDAEVTQTSVNAFTVTFAVAQSGTIIYK